MAKKKAAKKTTLRKGGPRVVGAIIAPASGYSPNTVATWVRLKQEGVPRHERLRRIAQLDGIYVPALYSTRICERSMTVSMKSSKCCQPELPVSTQVVTP